MPSKGKMNQLSTEYRVLSTDPAPYFLPRSISTSPLPH
jgi:hypothetical protein